MQPFMGKLADKYLAEALPAQTAEFLQRASAKLGEYETRGKSADPATLGYRVEDEFEWKVPAGIRRMRVTRVDYQPEAAGDFDG